MVKKIIGLVGMFYVIGIDALCPPDINKAQVFQRQDKPSVMRMYRRRCKDGIYVEDSDNARGYIPLSKYLNRIENKANRATELATIKKTVGWYE